MKIKDWKCLPCRERARLTDASSKERIMKGTASYRLLRGRKYINGVWYEAGDIVDLTEDQALNLRLSIEPYDSASHTAQFEATTGSAEFKTTLAESVNEDDEDGDEDQAAGSESLADEFEDELLDEE